MDRRVAATIQRRGYTLEISPDFAPVTTEKFFVSVNTPYRVSCGSILGGNVRFGFGDDAVAVTIYGPIMLDPTAEKPPPLGVHSDSIAAHELDVALCQRISTDVEAVVSQSAPRKLMKQ